MSNLPSLVSPYSMPFLISPSVSALTVTYSLPAAAFILLTSESVTVFDSISSYFFAISKQPSMYFSSVVP